LFDLSEIAAIGSISILFVHSVTHVGHLKIASKTGASKILVLLAAISSLLAMTLALIYTGRESNQVIYILVGFVIVAATTEFMLQKIMKREVRPRIV